MLYKITLTLYDIGHTPKLGQFKIILSIKKKRVKLDISAMQTSSYEEMNMFVKLLPIK